MAKIEKKTAAWVAAGILTEEQAQKIVRFEQKKGVLSLNGFFLLLGALSISLGIISLIASNWYDIPDSVKLTGMLVLLMLNAFGVAKFQEKNARLFEALLISQALLFLAAIGLVGQIFNLPPDTKGLLRFMTVLMIPLLVLTRSPLLFFIAIPVAYNGFLEQYFADFWNAIWRGRELFLQIAVSAAAFAAFSGADKISGRAEVCKKALTFYALIFVFLPLIVPTSKTFWFFLVQVALLTGIMFRLLSKGKTSLFNLASALVALRVIIAFFDLFGSLLQTGVGLIFFGVFVIGTALAWHKVKNKLLNHFKAEERS